MTSHDTIVDDYAWWSSLDHDGLLIAPSKLPERFPTTLPPPSRPVLEALRRAVTNVRAGDDKALPMLLDTVLEQVLALPKNEWKKGNEVGTEWSHVAITREVIKPRRIWQGPHGAVLPVFVADASLGGKADRLGIGRGRRAVSRVIEWLRRAGQKLALLTNGREWRLLHAGADYHAGSQWDIARWFEHDQPGAQVAALRALLAREALVPRAQGEHGLLLDAILATRKGQAELSSMLGERVRLAVEHIIGVSSASIDIRLAADSTIENRDIYIAATRLIMRCVVVLFAEARDLLPRNEPIYEGSYGLQSLRAELDRMAGGRGAERLRHSYSAWPRLMALFRLVYRGSVHQALPVARYGGKLFQPGSPDAPDPVLRAMVALEDTRNTPSDAAVHRVLELLTRSKVKVRQGRGSTWVEAPVDFTDLSSEYIGILYEGLLDFELRRAPADSPIVFLNLGNQPALPFKDLSGMTVKQRAELLQKLLKEGKQEQAQDEQTDDQDAGGEEQDGDGEGDEDDAQDDAGEPDSLDGTGEEEGDDYKRRLGEVIDDWARKAVRDAGFVRRGADVNDPEVAGKAQALIRRKVMPGEFFLVRWGGTRKGSGTFYTRPQLAGPTTRRTLQPLAYEPVRQAANPDTGVVTVTEWRPKRPEDILALKVCDPAMGSASFLISALRFLVDALVESLHVHGRLDSNAERTICRLADGLPLDHPAQDILPVPVEHEELEERLRARLRRHVVERCLYGVDLNPLAVELGQMALWVETMDRSLPFGFLDHKLKVGNSLVGCWLDRFQDYPMMAWEREGGDKAHDRFVHHVREFKATRGKNKGKVERKGDVWTQAIKERKDAVKSELVDVITGQLRIGAEPLPALDVHGRACGVFEGLHAMAVHETEERARAYAALQEDEGYKDLKAAFDTWCAVWFWPGNDLEHAPMPGNLLAVPREKEARARVQEVAEQYRFFHWELEFPDVFTPERAGFDAIIGNPPWEIQKPNSQEFFSNVDPLYRTYTKQQALDFQRQRFEGTAEVEHDWIRYNARLKALSNWVKSVAAPFGDPADADGGKGVSLVRGSKNAELHRRWRQARDARRGYSDSEHPFRHQGSADVNTYKLFLELAHGLLRAGGRLGFLTPSGLYSDNGSKELRRLFLERCVWSHVYAFQNERFVFTGIHHSFKMLVTHIIKGGTTEVLHTRFRLGPGDSPTVTEVEDDILDASRYLPVPVARIHRFSPTTTALLEVRTDRDLAIVGKIYENGVLLGEQGPSGWGIEYATEFHMTNDSKLFPERPRWEAKGYKPDEYGHWLKGPWRPGNGCTATGARDWSLVRSADGNECVAVEDVEDVALPLYEGRMIGQFDFSEKGWVSGKGRKAVWQSQSFSGKHVQPQYLIRLHVYAGAIDENDNLKTHRGTKVAFIDVTATTNTRSMIAAVLRDSPCGNSVPVLKTHATQAWLASILNSCAYDYIVRMRCGGLHLNWFVINETAIPQQSVATEMNGIVAPWSLFFPSQRFAADWLAVKPFCSLPWRRLWAITPHERLRLRAILDAVVAKLYGLDLHDFSWILRDCDHPIAKVCDKPFSRTLDPKGFWRVDKEQPPELRHTVLSLVAFHELEKVGLDAFLAMNDGESWMLPETVRLADYGLGHDDRATQPQPVAGALGPRFLDWQLAQDAAESWDECRRHAELIRRIVPEPEAQSTQESQSPQQPQSVQGLAVLIEHDSAAAPAEPQPPAPAQESGKPKRSPKKPRGQGSFGF